MKAIYKVNDKLTLELDSVGQKQLFEDLAVVSEIFSEGGNCGACGSTDVKYVVRENDGNKFYELVCRKCGAKLSFGAHKNNKTLFPHRKDKDGKWLDNKGWVKYIRPTTT